MSLRIKALLATLVSGVGVVVVVSALMYQTLVVGYLKIEESTLMDELNSAKRGLMQQVDQMSIKLGDWAVWDDTYKYIQEKNVDFEVSNLQVESLELLQIDAIVFQSMDGGVVNKVGYDRARREVLFPKQLDGLLASPSAMVASSGIAIDADSKLYIYARKPVLKSDGSGPAVGWITFAKYYTDVELKSLEEVVGVNLWIRPFDDGDQEGVFVKNDKNISSSVIVRDGNGRGVAVLTGVHDRKIFQLGMQSILLVVVVVLVGVVALSLLSYFQSNSMIIQRLVGMETGLTRIMNENGFSSRLYVSKMADEITQLEKMVNELLDNREVKEKSLLEEKNRMVGYLDNVSVMIFVVNKEGKIDYENRSMVKHFGERYEFGQSLSLIHDGDVKMNSKDGREMVVSWVINQSDYGRIYVGVDVTEMRNFEIEKEDRIRQLEIINQAMVEREAKMAELKEKLRSVEEVKI